MKFVPKPTLYATYITTQTFNIKNTSTFATLDLNLSTHPAASVWARTKPSVSTPVSKNLTVVSTLSVQPMKCVLNTNLNTLHMRFNRNTNLDVICIKTRLSLSFIKFGVNEYIWLSTIIRSSSYMHTMFGLLHLLIFPLLQTLTKNSTLARRPLTKTLKPLNNLLVNL